MPKITPTTNDEVHAPRRGRPPKMRPSNGNGLHIVDAHEPLGTGEVPPALISPAVESFLRVAADNPQVIPKVAPVAIPQPLKVALIGTAPSSRGLAPFNDPSWKIWACSPGNMGTIPRVDVWFELHGNLLWPENKHYGEPYVDWLNKQPFPVYMQDQTLVPRATVFPKDEMVKEFGKDFFTSSFSWMMALAITQGAKEISLYGIDMASRDEYLLQRPGFYYFRQMAVNRGIKVSAPNESDIMMHPALYAYSDVTPIGRKILARKKEINDRLTGMKAELSRLQQNVTYLDGAAEDVSYFESIWAGAQEHD